MSKGLLAQRIDATTEDRSPTVDRPATVLGLDRLTSGQREQCAISTARNDFFCRNQFLHRLLVGIDFYRHDETWCPVGRRRLSHRSQIDWDLRDYGTAIPRIGLTYLVEICTSPSLHSHINDHISHPLAAVIIIILCGANLGATDRPPSHSPDGNLQLVHAGRLLGMINRRQHPTMAGYYHPPGLDLL